MDADVEMVESEEEDAEHLADEALHEDVHALEAAGEPADEDLILAYMRDIKARS